MKSKSSNRSFCNPAICDKKGFGHWLNHDDPNTSSWIILFKCFIGAFIVVIPVVGMLLLPAMYYESHHPVIYKEIQVNGQKCTGWYRANTDSEYYTFHCPIKIKK
jgi:hypothetical protein